MGAFDFLRSKRRLAKVSMNHHVVTVLMPKENLTYEEGVKRIDRMISGKD